MTSAAIGITSPKMPSAATFANARSRGRRRPRSASSPNSSAPAHGSSTADPALRAGSTTAACRRGSRRTATAVARRSRPAPARVIGPAPGTGSRASRRARAPRAGGPTRRARGGAARSRARAPAAVWITSPSRTASNVTPATESSAISDDARRRPSSERTSTCRGRSSIASRIAWCPPAAASRPWMSTITRSASRSTSLSTCELTITVRPSRAELLEQRDEVQPLHRIGAVQRFVEHEHVRDRSRARPRPSCAGACPC